VGRKARVRPLPSFCPTPPLPLFFFLGDPLSSLFVPLEAHSSVRSFVMMTARMGMFKFLLTDPGRA